MNILHNLLLMLSRKKKAFRVELPIGLELSDGDRAALYGWPDLFVHEVNHD